MRLVRRCCSRHGFSGLRDGRAAKRHVHRQPHAVRGKCMYCRTVQQQYFREFMSGSLPKCHPHSIWLWVFHLNHLALGCTPGLAGSLVEWMLVTVKRRGHVDGYLAVSVLTCLLPMYAVCL